MRQPDVIRQVAIGFFVREIVRDVGEEGPLRLEFLDQPQ